jgi:uncharacterized protein YkwD
VNASNANRRAIRPASWLLTVVTLLTLASLPPARSESDSTADWVLEQLQEARLEVDVGRLERRDDLDAIAAVRAQEIAALPHSRRLTYEQPIGDQLRASGIRWFSSASAHLDMVRGYMRPEIGFLRSWKNYESAWSKAMKPGFDAIGVASHRADDGWVVFVAVLIEELPIPEDLRQVEIELIAAVNEVRAERGLKELVGNPRLSRVARAHSEDMAKRDFVGHINPEGFGAPERVNVSGINFNKLGENIQMSRGAKDPGAYAVEQWLTSPGHRATMLDEEFERTGVGVAMGEDGTFYFTQLFM